MSLRTNYKICWLLFGKMGSSQSARRLTISNEEEVGVIKVSNAIVQRLAQGEATKINESSSNTKHNTTNRQSAVSNAPIMAPQSEVQPIYYSDITMSALRIQQQKEEELKIQEQYWQKRLQNLKEGYQKIEHILEEEYKRAVNETSNTQIGKLVNNV